MTGTTHPCHSCSVNDVSQARGLPVWAWLLIAVGVLLALLELNIVLVFLWPWIVSFS